MVRRTYPREFRVEAVTIVGSVGLARISPRGMKPAGR